MCGAPASQISVKSTAAYLPLEHYSSEKDSAAYVRREGMKHGSVYLRTEYQSNKYLMEQWSRALCYC